MQTHVVEKVISAAVNASPKTLSSTDPEFYDDKASLRKQLQKEFGKDFVYCELLPGWLRVILQSEPDPVTVPI